MMTEKSAPGRDSLSLELECCEKCGQDCSRDARYCSACGTPLPSQIDTEAKKKRFELYKREEVRRFVSWALRSNEDIHPQRNSETGDYTYTMFGENPIKTISELESNNILEKYLVDTVPACPSCEHSNFYVDYLCPTDKHRGLTRGIMIEHYACACTDFLQTSGKCPASFTMPPRCPPMPSAHVLHAFFDRSRR